MMRRRRHKEPLPLLDLAMLALVAAFFSYSGYTFWNGKPRPPAAAQSAPTAALLSREIASVAHPPLSPEVSTQTINVDCLGSSTMKPLRTQANLLRVQGRLCGRTKKITGKNSSTEEELQIFLRGEKFTSHYFPLAKGLNKIVLEDSTNRTAKIQHLEITRETR